MTNKPMCLDLFCGAGGCSKGYQDAGFRVVGVDNRPMPRYCGDDFLQADALEILRILIGGGCIIGQTGRVYYLSDFALIAASPPCQKYTVMGNSHPENVYPDLLGPTRELLKKTGKLWVIENVMGAPVHSSVVLCGAMFGLKVYRHRHFETSHLLLGPAHIPHRDKSPKAGQGLLSPKGFISVTGHFSNVEYAKKAMDINWMTQGELAQAIPPAYTQWIGRQMLELIKEPVQ